MLIVASIEVIDLICMDLLIVRYEVIDPILLKSFRSEVVQKDWILLVSMEGS
jgi:hypothetical protein